MNRDEERELFRRWKDDGDIAARDKIATYTLGWVRAIAARFAGYGIDREELIAEGSLGVAVALERFDPERGTRFSTFATFWIRAHICDCIQRSGQLVSGSKSVRTAFWRIGQATRQLEAAGIEPTTDAIATVLGVEPEHVQMASAIKRRGADEVRLDAPVRAKRAGEERTYGTIIADDAMPVDEMVFAKLDHDRGVDKLTEAFRCLPDPRMERIVRERYLLDKPKTLRTIGKRLGLTRERVRQIEESALQLMRDTMTGKRRRPVQMQLEVG